LTGLGSGSTLSFMTDMPALDATVLGDLWSELAGRSDLPAHVTFTGPLRASLSVYEVSALASAAIGAATLAVAEFAAARSGKPLGRVSVERAHADCAFACERHLSGVGWQLPAVWDPLAGDYACRDGFIRLHTNYVYHRDAVLRVLGTAAERAEISAAVRGWDGEALEAAVVAAGGCAALMRSAAEFREHAHGRALANEPLIAYEQWPCREFSRLPAVTSRPLAGVRVLDLTRVIAGPIGTRFLAAYGADVLRVDPPGFEEVALLLPEVTAGKRRAALDLTQPRDRARFEALVSEADLIVHGYRAGALAALGYDTAQLRRLNADLSIVTHDAYGWSGPWATRRGFDSLVQMSCGIAWRGREVFETKGPQPLPAQALDHATGYLLAASACRALTERSTQRRATYARTSLARVAQLLMSLGEVDVRGLARTAAGASKAWTELADTAFGPVRRVRCPGTIEGFEPRWTEPAGPLGSHAPQWLPL